MKLSNLNIIKKRVKELLEEKNYKKIPLLFKKLFSVDIASIIDELDEDEQVIVFTLLQHELAAKVLTHVRNKTESIIIKELDKEKLADILEELESDEAAEVLYDLEKEEQEEILKYVEEEEKEDIEKILNYEDSSAGSLMTTDYYFVYQDMIVKDAIEFIREQTKDKDRMHNINVIDRDEKLIGVVPLRKLFLADYNEKIDNITLKHVICAEENDDQEEIAKVVQKYNLLSIPVVDKENKLLGVITVDDIMDVFEEEVTEDFYKMAGISRKEEESDDEFLKDYTTFEIVKMRTPWLLFCIFGSSISGIIIHHYESLLQSLIILAAFIPMVMGMAGNIGTQTAAIVIRSLAIGEIEEKDSFSVVLKEFFRGFIIAIICGLCAGLIAVFLKGKMIIGFIVALSMIISMTFSATIASLIPISLKKFNIDPALATGPFVSTFNDISGSFIYFNIAIIISSKFM